MVFKLQDLISTNCSNGSSGTLELHVNYLLIYTGLPRSRQNEANRAHGFFFNDIFMAT